MRAGDLAPDLRPPRWHVRPTNAFVRFEKEWAERSIPECFADRASRWHADRVAISGTDGALSYRELDRLSDRVGRAVVSRRGPRPEPVALLLDHEAPTPAVMLGILKAGKFYVPLDSSYPLDRNRYVLEDSQAELLITNERNLSLAASLSAGCGRILNLDEIASEPLAAYPSARIMPDDLGCVLYTSGSTGGPKGVMRTHRGLLHSAMQHTNGRHLCAEDRIALLFSYSFGAAMGNIFATLLNGATLLPFNLRELGVARLADWLIEREVTQFHTVPTVFRHLADLLTEDHVFPRLRLIRLGGETMFAKDVERFKNHFGAHCQLTVGMGTSESGHLFEFGVDKDTECPTDLLPVGYPVDGIEVLLLDAHRQPVGVGRVGEIAVRGSFVSPGYWRRPELTAKAFLPDPEGGDARIYLTGDLGCMLPDGCVFHLGRNDARVRIRGQSVEIPEVEAALLQVPAVSEAAVAAQGDLAGDRRLVAYVVPSAETRPSAPALRRAISEKLPAYMVPSTFVVLDALPLLPNGKVDRQALPRQRPARSAAANPDAAPRYLLEAQLCAIWEELLGQPGIGIRDDFYDLGGDSLLAVEMITKVEEVCGRKPELADFAAGLTLEGLTRALIDQDRSSFRTPVVAIQAGGAQRPFFFHNGDVETGGLYCRNLARHLGPEQPVYSLMAHGLDGDPVPDSIEAMAADRLQTVLAIQPTGPYRLGGFCYGGLVALEMAQQLQRRGHRVETLLMIDARARNVPFRLVRQGTRALGALLGWAPATEQACFRRLRTFAVALGDASQAGVAEVMRFLLRKPQSLATQGVEWLACRLDRTRSAERESPGRLPVLLDTGLAFWLTHLAVDAYVPAPYAGRIVLFRSRASVDRTPGDPTAGWRAVTSDVDVHWIPGDHRSCITREVAELARRMRPYLTDRAGPAQPGEPDQSDTRQTPPAIGPRTSPARHPLAGSVGVGGRRAPASSYRVMSSAGRRATSVPRLVCVGVNHP